jgi:hypothetical protein
MSGRQLMVSAAAITPKGAAQLSWARQRLSG